MLDYIKLLQRWRDLYENIVDLKARRLNMESVSHWLVEFAYHRLDDVEIPGQYFKVSFQTSPVIPEMVF